jgi:hypothetical protein
MALAALTLFLATASGQFTTTGRDPILPKYAAAFETRDQRDARKRVIEVVLSEEPVDVKAAIEDLDPHTQIINQRALMDHNYVLLWVRPDNDVSMNASYGVTQFVDMTPGRLQAEISVYTPDHVTGRLHTTEPVPTMGGGSYSIDVKFDTDVTRLPAGQKLGAGGGEPGKALTALFAAVSKKSYDGIKSHVTPRVAGMFSDRDDAIQTLGIWLPKKGGKITGGELRGDKAVLDLESDFLYLVQMVKDGDRWVFDRATRAGFIDSK